MCSDYSSEIYCNGLNGWPHRFLPQSIVQHNVKHLPSNDCFQDIKQCPFQVWLDFDFLCKICFLHLTRLQTVQCRAVQCPRDFCLMISEYCKWLTITKNITELHILARLCWSETLPACFQRDVLKRRSLITHQNVSCRAVVSLTCLYLEFYNSLVALVAFKARHNRENHCNGQFWERPNSLYNGFLWCWAELLHSTDFSTQMHFNCSNFATFTHQGLCWCVDYSALS